MILLGEHHTFKVMKKHLDFKTFVMCGAPILSRKVAAVGYLCVSGVFRVEFTTAYKAMLFLFMLFLLLCRPL